MQSLHIQWNPLFRTPPQWGHYDAQDTCTMYSTAHAELKRERRVPRLILASRGANARRFTREYSSTRALVLDCLEDSHVRALARSGSAISGSKVMQHISAQKCTLYSRSKLKVMPLSLYVVYTRTFIFQLVGSLKTSDFFLCTRSLGLLLD